VRHFFDFSDVRDVERADDFAERGGAPRRNADTYGEQKRWRDALRGVDASDRKVVR